MIMNVEEADQLHLSSATNTNISNVSEGVLLGPIKNTENEKVKYVPVQEKDLLDVPNTGSDLKYNGDASIAEPYVNGMDTHIAPVENSKKHSIPEYVVCEQKDGLFRYFPRNLRDILLTPQGVLFFLCWASTMQGAIVNGFVSLVVSTLEKRFNINSAQSGNIGGSYDIGFMLAIIPMTYFGGKRGASKPRYIAVGLSILGLGSFLFSLPHFLSEKLHIPVSDNDTSLFCSQQNNSEGPISIQTSMSNYLLVFIFGQILHGVGAAPILSLGMTLLDETVGKEGAPFYIGIFQIFLVLGPALGNVVGGRFLETYVDFDRSESPDCGSDDSLWIGAWWLGFVVGGFLSWFCAFFIFCYPSTVAKLPKKFNNKVSSTLNDTKPSTLAFQRTRLTMSISKLSTASSIVRVFEKESLFNLTEILKKIFQLLKNPTYILLCIGGGLDGVVISGLVFFLPKFIQSQFGGSPSDASILMGIVVVPAGGLGTFFGGYLVKKFKMSREQVLRMYILCQIVTIPCSLGFMFHCDNVPYAGITTGYDSLNKVLETVKLDSSCNNNCGHKNGYLCGGTAKENYELVCGSDQRLYFNPCYAGCQEVSDLKDDVTRINSCSIKKNFTDCGCVLQNSNISGGYATTDLNKCISECHWQKIAFMSCLFVTIWFTCMSAMPCVACILRFVEPENKSMSMGIANIIVRLIGSIPGPIIFGYIIDQSCVLESGNCLAYDNRSMSIYMMGVTLAAKFLGLVFIILTLISSKWCKIKDEDSIE